MSAPEPGRRSCATDPGRHPLGPAAPVAPWRRRVRRGVGAAVPCWRCGIWVTSWEWACWRRPCGPWPEHRARFFLALLAYAVASGLRATAWTTVQPAVPWRQAWAAIHVSLLGNHVLPFRLGEALRVSSAVRRCDVPLSDTVVATVALRAGDLVTLLLIAGVAAPTVGIAAMGRWGRGGDCRQPARHRVAGVAAVRLEVADRQPVSPVTAAWRLPPSARGCSRPRCCTPWPPQPTSYHPGRRCRRHGGDDPGPGRRGDARRRRHLRGGGHRRARGPRDRRTAPRSPSCLRRMRSRPRTASPSGRSRW